MKVIPTIFARNTKEFDLKFDILRKISRELQIDFMDGKFVEAKSVLLKDLPSFKGKGRFEAHLMVNNPESYIDELNKKGFFKILFHCESFRDLDQLNRMVFLIRSKNMQAWIVFNPKTDFNRIFDVLEKIHSGLSGIMLMGHTPGFEGKPLDTNVVRRVINLKRMYNKVKIQIDGGVNDKNIEALKNAGVDIVNVGSFVSKSRNPKNALSLLKKSVN